MACAGSDQQTPPARQLDENAQGRIKVRFFWNDRLGERADDERASAWIRVSQPVRWEVMASPPRVMVSIVQDLLDGYDCPFVLIMSVVFYAKLHVSKIPAMMFGRTSRFTVTTILVAAALEGIDPAWLARRRSAGLASRTFQQFLTIIAVRAVAIGVGTTNQVVTRAAVRDLLVTTAKFVGVRRIVVHIERRFGPLELPDYFRFFAAAGPGNDELVRFVRPPEQGFEVRPLDIRHDQTRHAPIDVRVRLAMTTFVDDDICRRATRIVFPFATHA